MSDNEYRYKISIKDQDSQDIKMTPSIYGQLVNCIGLKATISYVGEIKDNTVEIGTESVSSGWSASSLQRAMRSYPTLSQYDVSVEDIDIEQ